MRAPRSLHPTTLHRHGTTNARPEIATPRQFVAVAEYRQQPARNHAVMHRSANEVARDPVGLQKAVKLLRPGLVVPAIADERPVLRRRGRARGRAGICYLIHGAAPAT